MLGWLIPTGGGDPIPLRKKEIMVGRKPDCDVVLPFSNVSSVHCKFVLSYGYWYILDMHSTNGVKVNGAKTDDRRVDPSATVSIAHHNFTVEYDPRENGATGQPPAEKYHEEDIFSRSLLEKAGLQKPVKKKLSWDEVGSSLADAQIIVHSEQPPEAETPSEPKEFFEQLKFD
jgi:adenylate cyclase